MLQQRLARDVVAVLDDKPRIVLLDHSDARVMQRRHKPDRDVCQQHSYNRAMSQAVDRHHGRVEPDLGHDLVDMAVIALARIVGPCAAVALRQQGRIVSAALRRLAQLRG